MTASLAQKPSAAGTILDSEILELIKTIVRVKTYRGEDLTEDMVQKNLTAIKQILDQRINAFKEQYPELMISIADFVWTPEGQVADGPYRVFRYRGGNMNPTETTRKVCLICHLDTVPPGSGSWEPFDPQLETRIYNSVPTDFLIGRGTIDDKGPAVVALEAFLEVLRRAAEQGQRMTDVTIDVLFDTSEETDMSTPLYLNDLRRHQPSQAPDLGVVFDAFWAVRAEKGIERPVFRFPAGPGHLNIPVEDTTTLWIASMETSAGATNMIPDYAKATIQGNAQQRAVFANSVADWYRHCQFDDPHYHPADLRVSATADQVVITTLVAGAQHGSAPDRNREEGANPLVSLANFLAALIDDGKLARNEWGEMVCFIRWAFGTHVFGEDHPDLLSRYDEIFQEGNGTTFALTKLRKADHQLELCLDIRYALGHHRQGWDGQEGQVAGPSLFQPILEALVARYRELEGVGFTVQTETIFGPDVRSLTNANLFRLANAYRSVMGHNCPMRAIGGATDAHGDTHLVVAGALFTDDLGPPVNYHGIDEGAPLIDLDNSRKILITWLEQEIGLDIQTREPSIHRELRCCIC